MVAAVIFLEGRFDSNLRTDEEGRFFEEGVTNRRVGEASEVAVAVSGPGGGGGTVDDGGGAA